MELCQICPSFISLASGNRGDYVHPFPLACLISIIPPSPARLWLHLYSAWTRALSSVVLLSPVCWRPAACCHAAAWISGWAAVWKKTGHYIRNEIHCSEHYLSEETTSRPAYGASVPFCRLDFQPEPLAVSQFHTATSQRAAAPHGNDDWNYDDDITEWFARIHSSRKRFSFLFFFLCWCLFLHFVAVK